MFGEVVCDIQAFSFPAFTWISLLLLILMAICRFFQVSRLTAYKWFPLNRSYSMIMAIWSFEIILLISKEASSSNIYQFSSTNCLCSVSFRSTCATKHTFNLCIGYLSTLHISIVTYFIDYFVGCNAKAQTSSQPS